jgi:DNA-binding LytR/AlgR family response regulator
VVRFLDRVPDKLKGGAIYAVQAEDHYLRIRTSKGSDLILMRLSDAIAELEGIEGAQTHRWWVAKDGIAEVKRAEGRVALSLKDGSEAPVSRPNVRALRESGWI